MRIVQRNGNGYTVAGVLAGGVPVALQGILTSALPATASVSILTSTGRADGVLPDPEAAWPAEVRDRNHRREQRRFPHCTNRPTGPAGRGSTRIFLPGYLASDLAPFSTVMSLVSQLTDSTALPNRQQFQFQSHTPLIVEKGPGIQSLRTLKGNHRVYQTLRRIFRFLPQGIPGFAAAAASVPLLAACGGGSASQGGGGGAGGTIKFWDMPWATPAYNDAAKKIAEGFSGANSKASYQIIQWNNFYQTFSSAIASKTGPAVSTGGGFRPSSSRSRARLPPPTR